MISLHVYLIPKFGKDQDLESAIRDKWLAAMSVQAGFVSAVVLKPFPPHKLAALGAIDPSSVYEVVAFWRSESERLDWVERPIHDQMFSHVLNESESVTCTMQTIEHSWNIGTHDLVTAKD